MSVVLNIFSSGDISLYTFHISFWKKVVVTLVRNAIFFSTSHKTMNIRLQIKNQFNDGHSHKLHKVCMLMWLWMFLFWCQKWVQLAWKLVMETDEFLFTLLCFRASTLSKFIFVWMDVALILKRLDVFYIYKWLFLSIFFLAEIQYQCELKERELINYFTEMNIETRFFWNKYVW